MDWLTELIKTSPVWGVLIAVIYVLLMFIRNIEKTLRDFLEKFNKQQQEVEGAFRTFLIKQNSRLEQVITDYTTVLKDYVNVQRETNQLFALHSEINRDLKQILREHLIQWQKQNKNSKTE